VQPGCNRAHAPGVSTTVSDNRFAYLILLDPTERVVWVHGGLFDAARFDELRVAVDAQAGR
jgi:hypothetical protein